MRKSLPLVLLLTLSLLACNRQPPAPPAKDVKLTHLEENQKVSSNVLFTGTINTTQVIIKLTYQVGTGPEFDVTSGLNGNEFAFSVGSDKMQEGSNTITIHVYLKNGGTLFGTITLIYDPELPPVAGRDLVVLNDINPFGTFDMGESLLVNANNIQYVKNLVNFTPPDGVRKNSTVVWLDRGHGSGNCTGACPDGSFNEMTTLMETQNLTVEIHDSATGTLTSIPQNVKALFLWLPRENYTVPEINTLKKFALEGGRIVFIGEHSGFYGSGIPVENDFLQKMGAVMTNLGNAWDCGKHELPAASIKPHQITTGLTGMTIACSSEVQLGPNDFPLYTDTTNTHVLSAVAAIDVTPLPVDE